MYILLLLSYWSEDGSCISRHKYDSKLLHRYIYLIDLTLFPASHYYDIVNWLSNVSNFIPRMYEW